MTRREHLAAVRRSQERETQALERGFPRAFARQERRIRRRHYLGVILPALHRAMSACLDWLWCPAEQGDEICTLRRWHRGPHAWFGTESHDRLEP